MNTLQTKEGFFYEERDRLTANSAHSVLKIVTRELGPFRSVVDVGCGVGTWLKVSTSMGATHIKGFEGSWARENPFEIDKSLVEIVDLEADWSIPPNFDLGICLEVAEHLTENAGRRLVKNLSSAADVVIFSAAVPGQGGNGHINEQWPIYWQQAFEEEGLVVLDLVRPEIIGDESIPWWYRQNILVAVRKNLATEYVNSKLKDGRLVGVCGFSAKPKQPVRKSGYKYVGVKKSFIRFAKEVKRKIWGSRK